MEEKQRQKPGRKELPKELKRKIVTAYLTDAEKQHIIDNYEFHPYTRNSTDLSKILVT